MSPDFKICHLRYCRLIAESERFDVTYGDGSYQLSFQHTAFAVGKGFTIQRLDGQPITSDFLLWLSVYIGEDTIDPFQEVDTRFVWWRGDLGINKEALQHFLNAAQRAKKRKWPKWRHQLFDNAITYFSVAIRSGVNLMPLTLGFFALSLECLGNVRYGKRDTHFTFGDKHFLGSLTVRLAKLKQDTSKKAGVRAFEKRLKADVELLNVLRNAFYGHSLLHLKKDRTRLGNELRKWMVRYGLNPRFAAISFRDDRLRQDIVRESPALLELGIRLNRLFLFFALGFSRNVPFATHDFRYLGDHRDDEESEFRGIRTKTRFSQVPGEPGAIAINLEIKAPDASVSSTSDSTRDSTNDQ